MNEIKDLPINLTNRQLTAVWQKAKLGKKDTRIDFHEYSQKILVLENNVVQIHRGEDDGGRITINIEKHNKSIELEYIELVIDINKVSESDEIIVTYDVKKLEVSSKYGPGERFILQKILDAYLKESPIHGEYVLKLDTISLSSIVGELTLDVVVNFDKLIS